MKKAREEDRKSRGSKTQKGKKEADEGCAAKINRGILNEARERQRKRKMKVRQTERKRESDGGKRKWRKIMRKKRSNTKGSDQRKKKEERRGERGNSVFQRRQPKYFTS